MKKFVIILLEKNGGENNMSEIFQAYEAWHIHCIKEKIEDPWELIDKINNEFTEYKDLVNQYNKWIGTEITIKEPVPEQVKRLTDAKIYRDNYLVMRELWVGNYILENFGYNTLSIFAQQHKTAQIYDREFWKWFSAIRPCDGLHGQCSIFCQHFSNCNFNY